MSDASRDGVGGMDEPYEDLVAGLDASQAVE